MTKTALELAFATCDAFCEGLEVDEFRVRDIDLEGRGRHSTSVVAFAITGPKYELVFNHKGVLLKVWQISGQQFTEVGWKKPQTVLVKERAA